ncbi:MAG: DegT/DnrJ/EryC1/StrS family aminotransferase [Kofleriaceae bacterium]
MKVALTDLAAQYAALAPEIDAAVHRVLASGHYINGDDVAALEREMATSHAHAIAMSSGSDALVAALWALGVQPGDEVITTPFTFFATAGAIARLGATPVFADIDPHTFNLDPAAALARVTPHTRAIIPVHLFGRPADPIATSLPILEDAAQAVGSPGLGRLAALSFFPSKNLGAAGDAGMVLTDDAELADRIRLYRSHGARPKYEHHVVGANMRMDTLQAAILRVKLPHLAAWNEQRRRNAMSYRELLATTPLTLPTDAPEHVWHQFVVRAPRRDELRTFLREREIETEVYYPKPLHQQTPFARGESFPEAERAGREVLALPVHPHLERAQLEHVAHTICSFYQRRS